MNRKHPALTLVEVLVVIAIIGILVALLFPMNRGGSREAARRNTCTNNLKNIALALLNYADANGTFPPAYTVDDEGNRLHSWRTLILPYLEEQALYDSIDLTKPWDDPANAEARKAILYIYQCPSAAMPNGETTYLGVVGPGCFFEGSEARKMLDITDDTSTIITVIDAAPEHAVHWMSPEDISEDTLMSYDSDTVANHSGIVQAAFLDGHVKAISLDIDRETLRALLTIAGGEKLDE